VTPSPRAGIHNQGHERWRNGELVSVRGRGWHVLSSVEGDGAVAVRLRALADRERVWQRHYGSTSDPRHAVLLAPFDRLRRLARRRNVTLVTTASLIRTLLHIAAAIRPATGLWSAAAADIHLLPHQLAPVLAAAVHGATRVLVADEVGLGKTIQAGLLLTELSARIGELRALVLVPAGLRVQWRTELRNRFDVGSIDADAAWLRQLAAERPADLNPWTLGGVYVASHDFVKRPDVLRPLEDVTWDLVVIDEAHAMGCGTDRRAAAHAIARRSRRVLLLTATPHWDDARAFDALCDIGRGDGREPPPMLFRRCRADVAPAALRRSTFLEVVPSDAERRMHTLLDAYTSRIWAESRQRKDEAAALVAIVLRKRALSSAASLARSIRRRLELLSDPPGPTVEQLFLPLPDEEPLQDDDGGATVGLPCLSDARQEREWLVAVAAAADEAAQEETKVRRLLRLLTRLREPAIVFTEYRDTLLLLHERVESAGLAVDRMHGGMSPQERARVQVQFNAGGVVLVATDAASEGLNLHHACRTLVHFDLPWSVSRLEQRAGRVDRLGQTRRVHEIALVAGHTAERLVLVPLARRAAEARRAGVGTGFLHALSEERIAATVIDGLPLPLDTRAPAGARTSTPPATLDTHALAEVHRLEDLRRLLQRPGDRHRDALAPDRIPAIVVGGRGGELSAGLFLVYELAVIDSRGTHVHEGHLVVHIVFARRCPIYRRPSALRQTLALLLGSAPAPLRTVLDAAAKRELDAARACLEPATAELRRREHRMLRIYESAASGLVQAGLFDRRAMSDAARRERVRNQQRATLAAAARPDASRLDARVGLAAAVLVRPPRKPSA
jgi:superfamily II DNA or RNA helicase